MDTNDGQEHYEQALSAGRSWAAQQLELAGEMDVAAELEGTIPEAAAAYVALQTGQLPSLFFTTLAQRQLELDMSTGFQIGASDGLAEIRQSRMDGTPLSGAHGSLVGDTIASPMCSWAKMRHQDPSSSPSSP